MVAQPNLTYEHILLIMTALGKFHAVSFALKDQEPEKFGKMVNEIAEIFFVRGGPMSALVNHAEKVAVSCIDDDDDGYLLRALFRLYEQNQFDQLVDLSNGNDAEPYAVVVHGDLWSNNIMFSACQDEETNALMDIRFVDWQTARYGSPALDIVFCIFMCTTRELRGHNYNIYLQTYHESLSNLLLRYVNHLCDVNVKS